MMDYIKCLNRFIQCNYCNTRAFLIIKVNFYKLIFFKLTYIQFTYETKKSNQNIIFKNIFISLTSPTFKFSKHKCFAANNKLEQRNIKLQLISTDRKPQSRACNLNGRKWVQKAPPILLFLNVLPLSNRLASRTSICPNL